MLSSDCRKINNDNNLNSDALARSRYDEVMCHSTRVFHRQCLDGQRIAPILYCTVSDDE
jgi:hypothetical protein